MTNEEAIKYAYNFIDNIIEIGSFTEDERYSAAIIFLRKAVEAIKKQIPMKPSKWGIKNLLICPSCHRTEYIKQRDALDTYCGFCGQLIDWSDIDGD